MGAFPRHWTFPSCSNMEVPHPRGRSIYFSIVFIKFNLFQPKRCTICCECGKRRVMYSARKLTLAEELSSGHDPRGDSVVHIRKIPPSQGEVCRTWCWSNICSSPMEAANYASKTGVALTVDQNFKVYVLPSFNFTFGPAHEIMAT